MGPWALCPSWSGVLPLACDCSLGILSTTAPPSAPRPQCPLLLSWPWVGADHNDPEEALEAAGRGPAEGPDQEDGLSQGPAHLLRGSKLTAPSLAPPRPHQGEWDARSQLRADNRLGVGVMGRGTLEDPQ